MSKSRLLLAIVLVPFAVWLFLPMPSSGQSLQEKIAKKERQIEAKKRRERTLTSTIERYSQRIDVLQGDITTLQERQVRIEADLAAKRAELDRIQDDLRKERARITRLRARLAESRAALSQRLLYLYKADEPDVVTVVLESNGFEDLLQRTEFMQRVSEQDARILDRVRKAKAEATAAEARLDRFEARQRKVTKIVSQRRLEVLAIKNRLVDRRQQYESVRSDKRQSLVSTRADRKELQGHLVSLQKQEAKVRARLAGFSSVDAGPVRQGSGEMIWPTNGAFTSPFGQRWGRLHAGIDIGAPEGTPIRAALSGKVVLMGWTGGYGNYTCIQHGGALSTCYAHQSRYGTSLGANVSKGEVIGYVGNTGNSTGAHLHFETRVGGNPVNPMSYL
ncbi:peptidoglycan DD-metalloendopeptidase family protein [Solirubrobacter sp. CPCC 204708]|uniref:Peptidoglycan DD-metalloendopeptidase family protein n=1 Tax=Solirubrobacter deserti TaxID=2282478 RepID=A0ABT4RU05_9ACTN|nr:M23 family metallopeptidase [Solirubrobacter deserti]MBE2315666.1 peptidoglycan DD-metalloendopeptidase family protein [Solirubrobacter deserti]MDA0141756.1 peptidoglycan DD-metalloendopeptidase family protein [Solirubrobacter deserti]